MKLAINFLFLSWRSCPPKFHSLIYFLNGSLLSHLLNGTLMHWKTKRIFLMNLPLVNFIILLWRELLIFRLRVECLSKLVVLIITLHLLSFKWLFTFVLFKHFRTVVTAKSVLIILRVALIRVFFLLRKVWFFVISLLALALVATARLKLGHVTVLSLLQKVIVLFWLLTLVSRFFDKGTSLFVCWNCESFWGRTRRFLWWATIFASWRQIFLIEFLNSLETLEVVQDALRAEHSHRAGWFAFFLPLFHVCLMLCKQQIGKVNHVSSYRRRRFLAKCVCVGLRTDIFEVTRHFFGLHWVASWFIFSVRNDPLVAALFCSHRRRTLQLVFQTGWLGSFRPFSARLAPFKRLWSATAICQHTQARFVVRVGTAPCHVAHLGCHVLFATYDWLIVLFHLNGIFVLFFKFGLIWIFFWQNLVPNSLLVPILSIFYLFVVMTVFARRNSHLEVLFRKEGQVFYVLFLSICRQHGART